ncbi:hypothetical protein M4D55_13200 [Metabacillus idriensis]|uniref:Uncharacterized protein n=1 Tax=Metabacillus idriensis TaxID=324768 RepID=A0A6I2MDS5_9BACI|nr:hypothetical protein [Metabacillus idriensis]MCM3596722.1 hypothetical protein [Metabacillus idriensis]MRX56450.1 hypothetical protein [Metabacillus idriensis]OHR72689.1 hypothetical protein HMPREF3291_06075 [Bacillus sp. HMSC76G11]
MRMLSMFIFLLMGTIILILFIDIIQGNETLEALFNLKNILKLARGEDYFLIAVFIILFFWLFWSHIRGKK